MPTGGGALDTDGQGPTIPRKVCRPRGNELDSESFTIDLGTENQEPEIESGV